MSKQVQVALSLFLAWTASRRLRHTAWQGALDKAESLQHAEAEAESTAAAATSANLPAQQPVAELIEDEGLNAELNAANTGGLVETERDRLIRIVRSVLHVRLTCLAAENIVQLAHA